MHLQSILIPSLFSTLVYGLQIPRLPYTNTLSSSFPSIRRRINSLLGRQSACPAVWTDISTELTGMYSGFLGLNCSDDALATIRASFHDCFANGCDGSLFLGQEYNYEENKGLADISQKLGALAAKYNVSVADMFAFAGTHAIVTCPLGPRTRAWVGRSDSSTPAPVGSLPDHTDPADVILNQFKSKGFTALDLVALVGAHSTAKQFFVDPARAGVGFDLTPGQWDVAFYGQVTTGVAQFILDSDKAISQHPEMSGAFTNFALNQIGWNNDFIPAWEKMVLLGIPGGADSLIDCSSAIPPVVNTSVNPRAKRYRRWNA